MQHPTSKSALDDDGLLEHVVLRQDRTAFFALLGPHLGVVRRHAISELIMATADGSLGSGELSPSDVVDEVVALAYDRFEHRQRPLDRWLVRLLHECVDRRASQWRREANSITEEIPASEPSIEPDNAWVLENNPFWDEPEPVQLDEATADRRAVDPSRASESDDELRWLVEQLRSF